MNKYNLEVSKKDNGKYVPVGNIDIYYPLLSDLGFAVEPKAVELDKDGKEINQGLPVYADDKHQFAFDAVFAAVKADARNKLVTGTATLKDGASIAETMEDLLAVAERDGAALKALREMLNAFKEWLAKNSGKSTAVQTAILSLASNKKGLVLQPAEKKAKFQGYLDSFAASLTPEQITAWERPIAALGEAATSADPLDDM